MFYDNWSRDKLLKKDLLTFSFSFQLSLSLFLSGICNFAKALSEREFQTRLIKRSGNYTARELQGMNVHGPSEAD